MNAIFRPTTAPTLDQLAEQWQQAKDQEREANARRVAIEEQITALVGVCDEGVTSAVGERFKIKTTGKISRSIDSEAVSEAWDDLAEEVQRCFKWKAELDTKNYRALQNMRDDLLPQLNQFITGKPAKPSVTIEAKDTN